MGDSLDHRSHRSHGSMIVFSETWLLSTMSNYQSVNLKNIYIYNYPSSFHLGGGVWSHPFCSGLKATHSVWENMSFLRLSSPWSFPCGIWGNPRAISGDFNGNITNSKGKNPLPSSIVRSWEYTTGIYCDMSLIWIHGLSHVLTIIGV